MGVGAYIIIHHIRGYFHRKPKKTILVQGKNVNYEIEKHGDPMVIFVSGAAMSGTCMLPIQRKLSKYSISSLSYDRLGTGKSDSLEIMNFRIYAAHIHSFIQLVDNKSIVLVGHSFGGVAVEPTPADHLIKLQDFKNMIMNPNIFKYVAVIADLGILRFITDVFFQPFYYKTVYSFSENLRFYGDMCDGILLRKLFPEFKSLGDMFDEAGELIASWKRVSVKMDLVVGGGRDNPSCTPEQLKEFFKDTADRLGGQVYTDDSKGHVSILHTYDPSIPAVVDYVNGLDVKRLGIAPYHNCHVVSLQKLIDLNVKDYSYRGRKLIVYLGHGVFDAEGTTCKFWPALRNPRSKSNWFATKFIDPASILESFAGTGNRMVMVCCNPAENGFQRYKLGNKNSVPNTQEAEMNLLYYPNIKYHLSLDVAQKFIDRLINLLQNGDSIDNACVKASNVFKDRTLTFSVVNDGPLPDKDEL
ncbi:hypothetical protein HDV06_005386 [Boothiomyces sp. JEL0866]|nr:hypothetical protein HDV06_005386 [Boothiomyces sp. JEL0866]